MVATSRPWLSAYGSSVISIEKPKGLRRFAYRSFDLVADFKRLFGGLRHPDREKIELMASVKAELDRYFELLRRRVPTKVSTFILWLRETSSFWVRVVVAGLLILGGVFSFLPIFGLWMLPLGLLLIAQDIPILQKPLLMALRWIEAKWEQLRALFKKKPSG